MKKIVAAVFVFACSVMAADFWAKPYTDWSHNDLVKMVTNSPWARTFSVSLPVGPGNAGAPPSGGGGRSGRGGPAGDAGGGMPPGGAPVNIYARWQSALPVRQALARLKFGAEAATSPDAKKLLEREETDYMIVVSGPLRSLPRHDDLEALKKAIMDASSLSAQGKDVKASEVQIGMDQVSYDIVLQFPRSNAFTLEDKDAEFSTKYGSVTLKSKFKLKDMVYNGKLDM